MRTYRVRKPETLESKVEDLVAYRYGSESAMLKEAREQSAKTKGPVDIEEVKISAPTMINYLNKEAADGDFEIVSTTTVQAK